MSEEPSGTAVLLLAFNRPDTTARVFEAIRHARPARLYVAVDGPRSTHPRDALLCAEVKRIVSAVDWPCALHTMFRDENLGCKRGVSAAIDWFFATEEQGIILEDDCLPSGSFFRFCETLLSRFRDDKRVFSVQGNFFGAARKIETSYLFSKMFYMWGWATWADRWRTVSVQQIDVKRIRDSIVREKWLGSKLLLQHYWLDVVDHQATGRIDSWGYPVMFHCLMNRLFNATPSRNLVLNIGTGSSATHTAHLNCGPFHNGPLEVDFPLVDGAKYYGADEMLPFEHKWRVQLSHWRVLRHAMHYNFPHVYSLLRRALNALKLRSQSG
jgi:hypothetical protein